MIYFFTGFLIGIFYDAVIALLETLTEYIEVRIEERRNNLNINNSQED